MSISEGIALRTTGQFPVSVATSLALESICGIHPEQIFDVAPILSYDKIWINVRTLFRNFLGALDRDTAEAVLPVDIAETITIEMQTIESIVHDNSSGRCSAVFYFSNYNLLDLLYRRAVLRVDTTDRQKHYTMLLNATAERLLKEHKGYIKGFQNKLRLEPEDRCKALILTHYAFDLVSHKQFDKLTLVESHTGAVKEKPLWYTKYYNGKDLMMIPFREDMLQVFGDNETFRPADIKLRQAVIDVATKYKWTAATTRDKIRYGIEQIKNPYARDILLEMLTAD